MTLEPNTPDSRKRRRPNPAGEPCWACPYYKYDPVQHQRCRDYTLSRCADITQHIVRFHQEPLHCPICGKVFEGKDRDGTKRDHIREKSCVETVFSFAGATPDQIAEMRCKPEAEVPEATTSEERQWYKRYAILFGENAARPESPYRLVLEGDNAKQMCDRIQAFMQQGHPDLIAQSEAVNDGDMLVRFQAFANKLLVRLQGFILEPPRTSVAQGRGDPMFNIAQEDTGLAGYLDQLTWQTSNDGSYQHHSANVPTILGANRSAEGGVPGTQDPLWFNGSPEESYL